LSTIERRDSSVAGAWEYPRQAAGSDSTTHAASQMLGILQELGIRFIGCYLIVLVSGISLLD
jgi:hypothetical protein